MAPYLTKSAFQKGTRKFTKKLIQKVSKKEPKRDYTFRGVYLKKPSKMEPWPKKVPQASRRGPQAHKILKNPQNILQTNHQKLLARGSTVAE